jgi:hypothetical protein
MNRRSIGGHLRSIRWFTGARQRGSGATASSTGWIYGPGISSSNGYEIQDSKVLVAESLASDELPQRGMKHRMISVNSHVQWRATTSSTRWTDARKKHGVKYPMILFSAAFSRRLFGCLGLFIPLPLTHLRLLDCVEVQRSVRHLEDHIQAIQLLNFSPIDLHILCVCA